MNTDNVQEEKECDTCKIKRIMVLLLIIGFATFINMVLVMFEKTENFDFSQINEITDTNYSAK